MDLLQMRRLTAVLVPFFLLISHTAQAGCFPVPAPWGFAIACVLDREGKRAAFVCGAEDLDKTGGSYRMKGKCVHSTSISDSFGGDFGGPVEKTYFFEAKAESNIFNPITSKNTAESINLFNDPDRQDELGEISAVYTCQKDPFIDETASCKTEAFSTTVEGHDVLLNFQPLLRGIAGDGNIGTSQAPLKAAKPKVYTGIWRAGTDGYYLWRANGWSNFVKKWKELSAAGFRLEDIETFRTGNQIHFTGVWREGRGGHYLWRAKGWKAFTDKWEELGKKNLRLTNIETYSAGGERYYVGVWRSGKDGYYLWNVSDWKKFTDKWTELGGKNLRLIDIETFSNGSSTSYIGVWRAGSDGHYLWSVDSWGRLVDKWKELASKNLRLIDLDVRRSGGKTWYTGVWRSGTEGYALWHSQTWEGLVAKWEELSKKNLRLTNVAIQ